MAMPSFSSRMFFLLFVRIVVCIFIFRSCLEISLLILSKFRKIDQLLWSLKSSEDLWSFYDFRGSRS